MFLYSVVNGQTGYSTTISHVGFRVFVQNYRSRSTSREKMKIRNAEAFLHAERTRVYTRTCRGGSRVFFSSCYAASGNTYRMPVFQIPFYSSFAARSEQQPVLVCPTKFTMEPHAPCRLYFNTPGERLSGRTLSRCAKNLKYS